MSNAVTSPFTVFYDRTGQPLDAGYIYVGTAGINPEVSPITVYWDTTLTTTAAQPIRTLAGYPSRDGSPGTLIINQNTYSIVVRDSTGALVYSDLTASRDATPQTIANISALRALTGTPASNLVILVDSWNAGDGGGIFRYDATDTTTADNGGTVIVDASGKRWKRQVDGTYAVLTSFNAKGDNVASDGAALRAAFDVFTTSGGRLQVPHGTYLTDASGVACITVTDPVSAIGDGGVYTAINPASASASDNTIGLYPSIADHTLQKFERFALHNPNTGARVGNTGVYLDTQTAGRNLPLFRLSEMLVGQGTNASGHGVWHLNNPATNVNGGMYGAVFDCNAIKGGIKLENSGDSINVIQNIISGTGIGVDASLVSGASLLQVQANNITTSSGAIRIDAGSRSRILGNNIENSAAGAAAQNNSAIVNLTGSNGVIYGGVIAQNLISAFGASDATTLLRIANTRGLLVQDNVLLNGGTATIGISVASDCKDIRIGGNTFNAAVTTQVSDAGEGTMGVVKTATLQNSWVAFSAGSATLKYIKSTDGMVHVYGVIKDGTTANGTLIATLPAGFRPSEIIRAPLMVVNAGTPQLAEMNIDAGGDIRITYVLSSNQLNINFMFPSATLANAVSLE